MTSIRLRIVSALAAIAGIALFVWAIRQAGTTAVVGGIRRLGAGIVVVCLLGGVRALVRASAWRLCLDAEHRVSLASIFSAYLAGDAIGNITPFGFFISEPSKILFVRPRVSVPASVAALAVENLFYSASVVVMLVTGTFALLLSVTVPDALRIVSMVTVAVALIVTGGVIWIVSGRRRVISGIVERLIERGIATAYLQTRLPGIRETDERILGFAAERRGAVVPLLALEASYHAAAVAEIWFALALITGTPPHLLVAFILEYVNRLITIGFQFVPMWLGVDEAGTSLATSVLNLGPAAGVSLALARKIRVIAWTAIGSALLVHRGLSPGDASRQAHVLAAHSHDSLP